MRIEKPSIPKGTRDFGPEKMLKRQYILNTIRGVFEKFGYQPLETPAMENLSVLTGKYGTEGDQLLYKILNSGDFLSKIKDDDRLQGSKALTPKISEKGLRYDLTVPFARYVVMNQHDITFPFRRYQIQPVWRADRPQKGRYREFYQCDADVVGTNSKLCEAEIMLMIHEVLNKFGIDFAIKLNNRKLLTAITGLVGAEGKETQFCVAIDKLDKIGKDKVEDELRKAGFSDDAIDRLQPVFSIEGNNQSRMSEMRSLLQGSEHGNEGLDELEEILAFTEDLGLQNPSVEIDITLARGLSYYTGTILEVKAKNSSITSSITGGGRYDNLTGVFGLEGVSGVGFSFGVDRIFDVMENLNLFPDDFRSSSKVLLLNFDEKSFKKSLGILSELRNAGINCEIYPDSVKIKKQMNFANRKGVPFVLMIGENEIAEGKYQLKDMKTGEQFKLDNAGLIEHLNQN